MVAGFVRFVAENPNLTVFLIGFAVFAGALAAYSARLAGVVSGAILMMAAAYPFLKPREH